MSKQESPQVVADREKINKAVRLLKAEFCRCLDVGQGVSRGPAQCSNCDDFDDLETLIGNAFKQESPHTSPIESELDAQDKKEIMIVSTVHRFLVDELAVDEGDEGYDEYFDLCRKYMEWLINRESPPSVSDRERVGTELLQKIHHLDRFLVPWTSTRDNWEESEETLDQVALQVEDLVRLVERHLAITLSPKPETAESAELEEGYIVSSLEARIEELEAEIERLNKS